MREKINILIRTGFRPQLFARCLESIKSQNYPNIRVIVSIDRSCDYVPEWCETIRVKPGNEDYFYDCYLNDLKALVTDGWFMFLDDDEVLADNALLSLQLNAPAIIVKTNYMGRIYPPTNELLLGLVPMPSIVLHHSLKDIAFFDGGNHGDYTFIKQVQDKVGLSFQDVLLAIVDRKSNGL